MNLRGKQKRFLRATAHHYTPLFQVGKGDVNAEMIKQIDEALAKRELIKISLLQTTTLTPEEVGQTLEEAIHCQVVQIIGHVLVLFKISPHDDKREISNQVRSM